MHKFAFFTFGICALIGVFGFVDVAAQTANKPALPSNNDVAAAERKFADEVAAEGGPDAAVVMAPLAKARFQQSVIDTMTRPAESKPWKDYRKIFVNDRRIDD